MQLAAYVAPSAPKSSPRARSLLAALSAKTAQCSATLRTAGSNLEPDSSSIDLGCFLPVGLAGFKKGCSVQKEYKRGSTPKIPQKILRVRVQFKEMEPLTRIELVTSSLPRTRSTN